MSSLFFDRSQAPKTVLAPEVLDHLDHRYPVSDVIELSRLRTMFHAPATLVFEAFDELRRFLDPLITLLNLAGYEVDSVAVGFGPMANLDDVVAVMNLATARVHVEPIEYLTGLYSRALINDQFLALRVLPRHQRAPDAYAKWPSQPGWERSAAPQIAIPIPGEAALEFPVADYEDFVDQQKTNGLTSWFLDPIQEGWLLLAGDEDGPSPDALRPIAFERFYASSVELRDRVITAIMDKLGDDPKANLWAGKWVHGQRGLVALWDPASWLFDGEGKTGKRTASPASPSARLFVQLGELLWSQIDEGEEGESSLTPREAFERFLREEIGAGPAGEYGTGVPRSLHDRLAQSDEVGPGESPVHGSDFLGEVFVALQDLVDACNPEQRPYVFDRADGKLFGYTQLVFTALELGLFECPALVKRPLLPGLPRPGQVNQQALDARGEYTEGQGYSLGPHDGVSRDIEYPSETGALLRVLKADETGTNTYCVGITIDIFIRAWRTWCAAHDQPDRVGYFNHGGLLSFVQPWYNNAGVQGPGCYAAAQRFGLGVPIAVLTQSDRSQAARASAGDFVQLMRKPTAGADEGSGHSVMLLSWVDEDEIDWDPTGSKEVAGIRYWSTNVSTTGIGEATEMFPPHDDASSSWRANQWAVYVMRAGRV